MSMTRLENTFAAFSVVWSFLAGWALVGFWDARHTVLIVPIWIAGLLVIGLVEIRLAHFLQARKELQIRQEREAEYYHKVKESLGG
jgi:ethanolamine transporter EutH